MWNTRYGDLRRRSLITSCLAQNHLKENLKKSSLNFRGLQRGVIIVTLITHSMAAALMKSPGILSR